MTTSKNLTMAELYKITKSPTVRKMSSAEGEMIDIDYWAIRDVRKSDGEIMKVLSIADRGTGEAYATNSATFIAEFDELVDMCADADSELRFIIVRGGTSKNGRHYIIPEYTEG